MQFVRRLLHKRDDVTEFLKKRKRLVELKLSIEREKKKLENLEYQIFLEDKENIFISLADFLEIVQDPNFSIQDALSKFKHRSELSENSISYDVDVYVDDKHIIICLDRDNCAEHQKAVSNKLRLVAMRT